MGKGSEEAVFPILEGSLFMASIPLHLAGLGCEYMNWYVKHPKMFLPHLSSGYFAYQMAEFIHTADMFPLGSLVVQKIGVLGCIADKLDIPPQC